LIELQAARNASRIAERPQLRDARVEQPGRTLEVAVGDR